MKRLLALARPAVWWAVALGAAAPVRLGAVERFRPPDFSGSGHELPGTTTPPPRFGWFEALDVALLAVALGLAAYLVLRRRSRRGIVWLGVASLAYFGFYRRGCVCAIGAVQNVTEGLFSSAYAPPLVVLAFFVLPLAFALVCGRVFCAAVCPHGALQDLVALRPMRVPEWLERGLRVIPFLYLGLGILLAASGGRYLFCEFDPFIGLFRLTGTPAMLALGAGFLVVGIFVGRPYCRFLCPYGALLNLCARLARWVPRISPDRCIQCHLCEHSCPYGAINLPTPAVAAEPRVTGRRRLAWLLALVPVLMLALGWVGSRVALPLAERQRDVALAADLIAHEQTPPPPVVSDPVKAYRQTGKPIADAVTAGVAAQARFVRRGWIFGLFAGLVVGLALLGQALHRARTDYEADRGRCVGCGVCFAHCPIEHVRRGTVNDRIPPEIMAAARAADATAPPPAAQR